MSKHPALENLKEIDRRLDALIADNANLRAERNALVERLRQTPDLRQVIGELRIILHLLDQGYSASAETNLTDLLRRLDESG